MRILLSGASGFLGSRLAGGFLQAGHQVAVVLRSSSSTRRLREVLGDLTVIDAAGLEHGAAAFRPDAVVHAATCYGRHGEAAAELIESNIAFPARLLRCANAAGSSVFVNSDTTLPPAVNAYALSKSQFLQWCEAALSSSVRIANVRLEYVYGPDDDVTKFPAHVIRQCVRNVPELKLSPGRQMRDFVYVDDAAHAYVVLTERAAGQEERLKHYGLGTGVAVTIRHFAETAKHESGSSTALHFGALPYREGEPMRSCADVSELERLGWRHRVSLPEGIRRVIRFERERCVY